MKTQSLSVSVQNSVFETAFNLKNGGNTMNWCYGAVTMKNQQDCLTWPKMICVRKHILHLLLLKFNFSQSWDLSRSIDKLSYVLCMLTACCKSGWGRWHYFTCVFMTILCLSNSFRMQWCVGTPLSQTQWCAS